MQERHPDDGPAALDVTVVMPVRNEGPYVEAAIADLLAQDLAAERLEILVVDGDSTDDTRAVVEAAAGKDSRVRLLENPRRLSSVARAIGAAAARGSYVAYVDGHCRIPSKSMLSDMVALFEKTGAQCLARPQPLDRIDDGGGALVARAIAAARHSPLGHSASSEIYRDREGEVSPVSSGAMYRREVFEKIGTFDPSFDACEDVEFNWRVEQAGFKTWTSPRLAVVYEPRRTLGALFRQMRRYGLGRARLHRKHPAAFTWESLVPAAFVVGLLSLPATPLIPEALRLAWISPYALYLALVLAFSVAAAARRGWALLPLLPVAFAVIHMGLGIGYLQGRLLPSSSSP